MIYNLFEYLNIQLPDLTFIVDGWENDDPIESTLLKQTGGDLPHWFDRLDYTVQFLSRSQSKVSAKQSSEAIFTLLRNKFGCIWPETTVEGVLYPELTVAQVSPIQIPGYIGTDENKNHMYSVNFQITVGG